MATYKVAISTDRKTRTSRVSAADRSAAVTAAVERQYGDSAHRKGDWHGQTWIGGLYKGGRKFADVGITAETASPARKRKAKR